MRFVADSMVGKLAKWLRVLGYDTHYERSYGPGAIDRLVRGGRYLVSRHKGTVDLHCSAVLLHGNRVGEQLVELRARMPLSPARSQWFSRCLICNVLLEGVGEGEARENVPEYIFFQNMTGIRSCPLCGRYYWPGSHRARMVRQLEEWGFGRKSSDTDPAEI
jgi:uncharacterized protein with PIN domain